MKIAFPANLSLKQNAAPRRKGSPRSTGWIIMAEARKILIVTPHLEPPVTELGRMFENNWQVSYFVTNPVQVQGERRGQLARLGYYWIDPIVTMFRVVPTLHKYCIIVSYYHRNGYWLGLVNRLFRLVSSAKLVWVGFAPNPRKSGIAGAIKEFITRAAVSGHDLVICNTKPVVEMCRNRFPAIARRVFEVRWGGNFSVDNDPNKTDHGYVFCGGRTNRDFDTVLQAVSELACPAVFVVPGDFTFASVVPAFVSVYRDIPEDAFYELLNEAQIVILALKRADISSGQVVLGGAMSCGKPIVAAAIAGLEDYVADGKNALLYRSGDADDLGRKIRALQDDPRLRKALSAGAQATYAKSFNSRVFAEQLRDVIIAQCGR